MYHSLIIPNDWRYAAEVSEAREEYGEESRENQDPRADRRFGRVGLCLLVVRRHLHCSDVTWAVDKSLLSKLRKKTGFPFVNCKKALEKHENDIVKAESWLKEQAQKEGWEKASKLQGRPMSQGLVAILQHQNTATMIEVNCETDFVARNTKFQTLVQQSAAACSQWCIQQQQDKIILDSTQVGVVPSEGKTLGDLVAMTVGSVGENMVLRRAAYMQVADGHHLGSYIHAAGKTTVSEGSCQLGRFGALVAFSQTEGHTPTSIEEIGRNLGQHIVGMNPKIISDPEEDKPEEDNDNEGSLIYQEFLLDTSLSVQDYLVQNCVAVEDFVRFECGEVIAAAEEPQS